MPFTAASGLRCIEILPRLSTPAGFEPGSRIIVNNQAPDQATADLRTCL